MAANTKDIRIVLEDIEPRLDTTDLRKSVTQLCREGKSAELHRKLEGISKDERQKLLNTKDDEGTTALHESCCHGESECAKVLLRNGADAIIWDIRGFSPIHCAAYNGHVDTIDVLLKYEPPTRANMTKCEVDTLSQYNETALHIACLRGHLDLAYFLVEKEASLTAVDRDDNTVLHYAVASNSGKLLTWLLSMDEVKAKIGATNRFKQTVAHRAAVLGCVMSVSVLVHFNADFNAKDKDGRSAIDLARLLSNRQCYDIATKKKTPLSKPESPFLGRAATFSMSSSDALFVPQRSVSNGSSTSPATGSPQLLKRRGSMTRRTRPISYISRTGSFQSQDLDAGISFEPGHRRSFSSRGSLQALGSSAGYGPLTGRDSIASIVSLRGSTDNFRYTSKETLTVVREDEKTKQKSKSLKDMEMKLLFASTYEPPPDLHFIPPLECDKLTPDNDQLYSKFHDIILRIPGEHWEVAKDKEVEVRVCATVGLNQYPENYIIVSPICFISCKSEDREVSVKMKLPHAASIKAPEYERKICILSTMSTVRSKNPNTPLSTPTDRKLHSIDVIDQELGIGAVHFKLKLLHPALFAVAVTNMPTSEVPRPIPIPLRSALYVLYKVHDGTSSLTRVFVHAYVALRLKTVDTDMRDIAKQEGLEVEYSGFELNGPSVVVTAGLINPRNMWDITPLESGLFGYNQIALTSQSLDHDHSSNAYSHDHPYPLRQRFFIEPMENARGAVKCEVIVSDSEQQRLTAKVVVPYSPTSKDATPEPSSCSSTRPPSPTNSRQLHRSAAQSETGSLSISVSSRNPNYNRSSESVV